MADFESELPDIFPKPKRSMALVDLDSQFELDLSEVEQSVGVKENKAQYG